MKEVIEMAQILLKLRTDTYLKCKYTLLAISWEHQGTHNFIKELFRITDSKRPLLIGMLEGRESMQELIDKYGISEMVTMGEKEYPLINIPMMSDEKWQELSRENAVHNFIRQNGREPVDVDEAVQAVQWQRGLVAEVMKEAAE